MLCIKQWFCDSSDNVLSIQSDSLVTNYTDSDRCWVLASDPLITSDNVLCIMQWFCDSSDNVLSIPSDSLVTNYTDSDSVEY